MRISIALAISASDLALPCSTMCPGSTPVRSAASSSPSPATSSPHPAVRDQPHHRRGGEALGREQHAAARMPRRQGVWNACARALQSRGIDQVRRSAELLGDVGDPAAAEREPARRRERRSAGTPTGPCRGGYLGLPTCPTPQTRCDLPMADVAQLPRAGAVDQLPEPRGRQPVRRRDHLAHRSRRRWVRSGDDGGGVRRSGGPCVARAVGRRLRRPPAGTAPPGRGSACGGCLQRGATAPRRSTRRAGDHRHGGPMPVGRPRPRRGGHDR